MIKLIKSTFYQEQETKKKLNDFITSATELSMGEQCRAFENEFAQKQGRKYGIFVNSGSSANLILLQALINLKRLEGASMVAFSALTWPTNVMPIMQLGLRPVPLDCELDTLNVSPQTLKKITPKPACIFLTNVLGFCDDIAAIRSYCAQEHIILLEDNCESLGSKVGGELLGNFSLASTFSFFVGHHLSTIEGGMVCTDDEELREMLALVRAHGWDRNFSEARRHELQTQSGIDEFYARYSFYDLAYNVRPSEINGFIGRIQLAYWDDIVSTRERQYKQLAKVIQGNKDLLPMQTDHMDIVSNFAVPVICKNTETFKAYRERFDRHDVEIRPIIAGNMVRQPFYKKYARTNISCPNADTIHTNGFYFGNNPDMTNEELDVLGSLLTQ